MSKLIDMLRRGKGEIAETIAPLVEAGTAGQRSVKAEFRSEGALSPQSSPDAAPVALPFVEPPVAARPVVAPPNVPLSALPIRTLGLRVPAPSPLLPFDNGHWAPSEQYRILRTKISQHPAEPSLIVITSPGPGDGKTVTAINTAAALALRRDAPVLLLDADLRRSALHVQLGLPKSPGLAEVLEGACALEEALVHTQEFANLYVMTCGIPPANPVELLDSTRWRSLCDRLREMFRYVIIDSPPVGGVADYELIQAVCDGIVLVLRPDFTNRGLCLNALQRMPQSKFLGVLLNCAPDWWLRRHAGSDYYYYSGGEEHGSSKAAAESAGGG